jgi:hypothetical protein
MAIIVLCICAVWVSKVLAVNTYRLGCQVGMDPQQSAGLVGIIFGSVLVGLALAQLVH